MTGFTHCLFEVSADVHPLFVMLPNNWGSPLWIHYRFQHPFFHYSVELFIYLLPVEIWDTTCLTILWRGIGINYYLGFEPSDSSQVWLKTALYFSNTSSGEALWSQKISCQLCLSVLSQFQPKRLDSSPFTTSMGSVASWLSYVASTSTVPNTVIDSPKYECSVIPLCDRFHSSQESPGRYFWKPTLTMHPYQSPISQTCCQSQGLFCMAVAWRSNWWHIGHSHPLDPLSLLQNFLSGEPFSFLRALAPFAWKLACSSKQWADGQSCHNRGRLPPWSDSTLVFRFQVYHNKSTDP